MQKHSSYVYLKIGRLSWAFMAPLGTCALWRTYIVLHQKHMAITRHTNPAQYQGRGISDGLICTWTMLSCHLLLAMLSQEMLYSLPEDLWENLHRCVSPMFKQAPRLLMCHATLYVFLG
jgi:hypothetical protein